MSLFDEMPATSNAESRPMRLARCLLVVSALLGGLHFLVALPHFAVRIITGKPFNAIAGVKNIASVTESLWRGSAPTAEGYAALADIGIVSVIDLRAEVALPEAHEPAAASGIDVTHIPIRDGQPPTPSQVGEIAATIYGAAGATFVHCQAGVGRTGSVVAALRVADGGSPRAALVEALRFGPLSLEQQVFVLRCDRADASLVPVVLASRIIDSPRRLLSRIRS